MSNEILWILLLLVNFGCILFAYRVFSISGLYVWIALAGIVANMQAIKTIEVFGLTATLGNIVYAGSFLATDILSECHGKHYAVRGVWMGAFAIISTAVLMQFALLFAPAPSDIIGGHFHAVFAVLPRVGAASLCAYLTSQLHDVWAYNLWRMRFPRLLWVRNNISTIMSQIIDSIIFTFAAFAGIYPFAVLIEIIVTTVLFKLIVAVLDTPFLYLAAHWSRAK